VSPRGYTTEELLDAAEQQETPASRRLLHDWTGLGLLDHPARPGRGRRVGGWGVSWPETQRSLWLLLLHKRRGVKRIETLCNVPVIIWLIWGDDYVPVGQVRRAMETWAGRWETSSKKRAYWSARHLVADLGVGNVWPPARNAAIDAIADMGMTSTFDRDRLVAELRKVMDPDRTGRPRGALMQVTPETYADAIEARMTAMRALPELPDDTFHWARYLWQMTRSGYAADQPRLAADPELGHLAEIPTLDSVANNACVDLLTILGLVLMASRPGNPKGANFDKARSSLLRGESRGAATHSNRRKRPRGD